MNNVKSKRAETHKHYRVIARLNKERIKERTDKAMTTRQWTNPKTNETMTEEQYQARIREYAQTLIEDEAIDTLEDYIEGNFTSFYEVFTTPKEVILKQYDDYVMDIATRWFHEFNWWFYEYVEE